MFKTERSTNPAKLNEFLNILNMIEQNNCPTGFKLELSFVSQNKIDIESGKALVRALQSGHWPADLALGLAIANNTPEVAKLLAEALKSGRCPVGLKIRFHSNMSNTIGIEGATALAQALASGCCPENLLVYLGANALGDEGAQVLAQALASGHCPAGLQIFLKGNGIGNDGAKAFAEALKSGHCPAGLKLYLDTNHIGEEGAMALAQALASGQCPPNLTIDLRGNKFFEGNVALTDAWKKYHHKQSQLKWAYLSICAAKITTSADVQNSITKLPTDIIRFIFHFVFNGPKNQPNPVLISVDNTIQKSLLSVKFISAAKTFAKAGFFTAPNITKQFIAGYNAILENKEKSFFVKKDMLENFIRTFVDKLNASDAREVISQLKAAYLLREEPISECSKTPSPKP